MAQRPVFTPVSEGARLVQEYSFEFSWNKGMAPSQKVKNIHALHDAAKVRNLAPLLEVSSKSETILGQRLSAFNLKLHVSGKPRPLESIFQGSKVFIDGGPYVDILDLPPLDAKRDPRVNNSRSLVRFELEGTRYPLIPRTAFYDWIYIRTLYPHRNYLKRLQGYAGFTDIEFNPERSINCQARSCATYVSLDLRDLLPECVKSFEVFRRILEPDASQQPHSASLRQGTLL